tara:strand:+ start:14177 stop:14698 length:522 start_codon:yes stop_codon:yes gene_type:complete
MSFAFILYFGGQGQLDGPSLKLPMVNIIFERPEVLAISAWCFLLWFAIRWAQLSRGMLSAKMSQELSKSEKSVAVKLYIRHALRESSLDVKEFSPEMGYGIDSRSPMEKKVVFRYKPKSESDFKTQELHISGIAGKLMLACLYIKNAITLPAASQFGLPWVVFMAAISAPLWS